MADDDVVLPVEPAAAEAIAPVEKVEATEPKSVRETIEESVKTLKAEEKPSEPEKAEKAEKPAPKVDATGRVPASDGKFAPKDKDAEPAQPKAEKPSAIAAPVEPALDKPADAPAPVAAKPPHGWSIKSKAAWDALPDHIREDIKKREDEVSSGYKDYAALKPFAERAKQSGTTLVNALQSYTAIEDLLRQDKRTGFLQLAQNLRLTQHQAGQLFGQLAQQLGHAAPPHQPGGGSTAHQPADADPNVLQQMLAPYVMPLVQEIQTLKSGLTQQQEAEQHRRLSTAETIVNEFKDDPKYRYFDDLEPTIERFLGSGIIERTGDFRRDLETAYDKAAWDHPEIREALINERQAKAREAEAAKTAAAKRAAVSIKGAPQGAPMSGLNGSRGSVRADIEAAFATLREGA